MPVSTATAVTTAGNGMISHPLLASLLSHSAMLLTEFTPGLAVLTAIFTTVGTVMAPFAPILVHLPAILATLVPIGTTLALIAPQGLTILVDGCAVLVQGCLVGGYSGPIARAAILAQFAQVLATLILCRREGCPILADVAIVLAQVRPILTQGLAVLGHVLIVLAQIGTILANLACRRAAIGAAAESVRWSAIGRLSERGSGKEGCQHQCGSGGFANHDGLLV